MHAKHIFDFEGRDFVASAFDDVDARSPQQPIRTILLDADIARAEPSIEERRPRAFWLIPVFAEDAWTLQLHLTIDNPDGHPGQRMPDKSGATLAVQRIRQRHADFAHSITFKQGMPGDVFPSVEHSPGKGRRSAHHQAERAAARATSPTEASARRLPGMNQTVIDRRNRRENRELAGRKAMPHRLSIELRNGPRTCAPLQSAQPTTLIMPCT